MTVAVSIDESIHRHFNSTRMQAILPGLRRSYSETDFVEIPAFLPDVLFDMARVELEEVFDRNARRRDLTIAQSGNTPRKYSNVDREALIAGSRLVPAVFRSPALYSFLEQIVGEHVHPIPYLPEEFIAARLHQAGDVHGWHWDDYTWALVWIFKIPDVEIGGSVEYVKDAPWDATNPRIAELVAQGPVELRHPSIGSAYLLRAGTALHRVTPLRADAERMIVCYSFATTEDLSRPVDHSSMEALYPESHETHRT